MSNDTDHEPENDLIQEHLAGLIELMERNSWKVTGVRIDVECNRAQHFVLVPVDGQAATTNDFSALLRDEEPLH